MSQAASDEQTSTDVTMAQSKSESSNSKIDYPVIVHEEGNIGVFWDMIDYPVVCEDPVTIYTSVKKTLKDADFKGEKVSIKAYVDDDKFSPELLEEFKNTGIHITTFGNRGKVQKTRLLRMDVLRWTLEDGNTEPANVFLLSKDAGLISQFEILYFHRYGVFLSDAQPSQALPPGECKDWLLSGIPKKRKPSAISC